MILFVCIFRNNQKSIFSMAEVVFSGYYEMYHIFFHCVHNWNAFSLAFLLRLLSNYHKHSYKNVKSSRTQSTFIKPSIRFSWYLWWKCLIIFKCNNISTQYHKSGLEIIVEVKKAVLKYIMYLFLRDPAFTRKNLEVMK